MTPQEIVDRILDFSLDETDADNNLETRVLQDVQVIYNEVQQKMSDIATADDMVTTTIAVTDGLGTIPEHLRVHSVFDTTNSRFLATTDVLSLEQEDPELATTGAPNKYYVTNKTEFNTYPLDTHSARVRYMPVVNTLSLTDDATAIRIPVQFHNVLVDGGVYLMAVREQGFHDRLDRGEKFRNYQTSLGELLAYTNNRNRKDRKVAYHDF